MSVRRLHALGSTIEKIDAAHYLNTFSKVFKWKPYKETILDVGCGDGTLTRGVLYPFVKNNIEKIHAIDKSPTMIKYARSIKNNGKIEFSVMDVSQDEDVDKMLNKFDHVFSFYYGHWILDQRSLMQRFYKMLKPNSQLFLSCLTDTPFHKAIDQFYKEEKWTNFFPDEVTPFVNYGENPIEYLTQVLEQAGFDVNAFTGEKKHCVSEGFGGLVKALVSLHDFTNYIPEKLREQYIQDIMKISCECSIPLENPGTYNWSYESYAFIATKK